ncbi:MAG: hypothetical protein ABEJ61_04455 [Haloferacaceae archaeon]
MVPLVALAHLTVRVVHVLAMAAVVGGACVAAALLWRDVAPLATAVTYEWLFWAGAGLLVATGVGNLGALAPAVPGGRWGAVLAGKLVAVGALLVGSLLRTLVVCRVRAGAPLPARRLRRGYGATAAVLVGVVVLAEVLAHG